MTSAVVVVVVVGRASAGGVCAAVDIPTCVVSAPAGVRECRGVEGVVEFNSVANMSLSPAITLSSSAAEMAGVEASVGETSL